MATFYGNSQAIQTETHIEIQQKISVNKIKSN
jgi:hypothetical protein